LHFKIDDIEEAHSHVNFMDMATNRAAFRLADQHDQEVLGYLSGYKQSALHANAGAVNNVVNGTKANTAAGTDELLAANKLKKSDFGNITTASAGITRFQLQHVYPEQLLYQQHTYHQQC